MLSKLGRRYQSNERIGFRTGKDDTDPICPQAPEGQQEGLDKVIQKRSMPVNSSRST
jgi:hypothetical protein